MWRGSLNDPNAIGWLKKDLEIIRSDFLQSLGVSVSPFQTGGHGVKVEVTLPSLTPLSKSLIIATLSAPMETDIGYRYSFKVEDDKGGGDLLKAVDVVALYLLEAENERSPEGHSWYLHKRDFKYLPNWRRKDHWCFYFQVKGSESARAKSPTFGAMRAFYGRETLARLLAES